MEKKDRPESDRQQLFTERKVSLRFSRPAQERVAGAMPLTAPHGYSAYVYERYGRLDEVLRLSTVERQPLPPGHVRVRVYSASLNPIDYKVVEVYGSAYTGGHPSAEKPYGIGFDVAGVVVEVGTDVKLFSIGDEVYGKGAREAAGALAEYFTIDAECIALKPRILSFQEASGVPGASLCSYQVLTEQVHLQPQERLLVLGGSTACGIFAIQFAKLHGVHVVATTSTRNVSFVQSIGADQVIDYTTTKWGEVLERHSIDVIYDCGVEPLSWEEDAQLILKANTGRFATLTPGHIPSAAKFGATYSVRGGLGSSVPHKPQTKDLEVIASLIDTGKVRVFIDSVFAFDQVLDAFARLKTKRAVGKIVVAMKQ